MKRRAWVLKSRRFREQGFSHQTCVCSHMCSHVFSCGAVMCELSCVWCHASVFLCARVCSHVCCHVWALMCVHVCSHVYSAVRALSCVRCRGALLLFACLVVLGGINDVLFAMWAIAGTEVPRCVMVDLEPTATGESIKYVFTVFHANNTKTHATTWQPLINLTNCVYYLTTVNR